MKTIILFWNPSISSYTIDRLTNDIHYQVLNDDFDWSIRDHQQLHQGDRFFMVRCKNKPVPGQLNQWGKQLWAPTTDAHTGICMAGTFISDPYRGEDWSGKGREVYYAQMYLDVALNPNTMPVLTSDKLAEAIPDFDWTGGSSGRLIDDAAAEKLAAMWDVFCKEHKEQIKTAGDNAFIDEDYLAKLED